MGKGLTKVILSQVCMGIYMNKMEIWVNSDQFFNDWKGDEMVTSKQDRELSGRKDFSETFPDQVERYLFLSEGEFKVSHIVDRKTGEVLVEIRAEGFDPP